MLEKMQEIIAEQLSVDADSITESSSFKEDLEQLATVGDVMNYLKSKGVEA